PTRRSSDLSGDDGPHNVWGFVTRDGGGVEPKDDWDAMGMRASQSSTTVLRGAHAPADRIVRRIPPGPTMDPFIFGIFANFEILLASVYVGIAQRAIDVAVERVRTRRSLANDGAPYAHDPAIRWRLADAAIQLDGIYPQLAQIARDVDELADRGCQGRRGEGGAGLGRGVLLQPQRALPALPRRARRDLPPQRRRVRAQRVGERAARARRGVRLGAACDGR